MNYTLLDTVLLFAFLRHFVFLLAGNSGEYGTLRTLCRFFNLLSCIGLEILAVFFSSSIACFLNFASSFSSSMIQFIQTITINSVIIIQ